QPGQVPEGVRSERALLPRDRLDARYAARDPEVTMRVTFNAQNPNTTAGLEGSATRLLEFQRQVSTGKRIEKPSDDPSATLGAIGEHGEAAGIAPVARATDSVCSA